MTRCIGVFRAECGTECIDVLERHSVCFAVELTAYREVSGLAEEVLRIIDGAVFVLGQVVEIHCCDLEHFACTFTVAARDDGSMDIVP